MPDLPQTSKAVFLSYAHEDGEAARRIADALRGFGVEVWFDLSELRGGDSWDAKIRRQIRECALFIPIISANTQARGEGYFRREWRLAVERTYDMSDNRAYLVPVITDGTPEAHADVPEQFLKAQFTRLVGGVPTAHFVDNIKRLLHTPLEAGSRPAPAPSAAASNGANGPDPKSIAVLPFVNWSTDAEQGFFADGLSEELLNLLARVPELQVTSRSSAFSYKGKEIKIAQVARELNVANILEGSVRRSGNRLRITAQLIDARSDRHLWSQTFDRTMDDIFAVQDEISAAVVEQLKVTLLGSAPKAKAYNPKAYTLYLQARELQRLGDRQSLAEAVRMCEEAIRIDHSLAAAWVAICSCYQDQADYGLRPNEEGYRMALEAANKALSIDPDNASAHSQLGMILGTAYGDFKKAAFHIERALELEPSNIEIIVDAGTLARLLGRLSDSVRFWEFSVQHDPVNANAFGRLGGSYLRADRLKEAREALVTSIRLAPGRLQSHMALAEIYLREGNPEAALGEAELEFSPMWRMIVLVEVYHALGRTSDSDKALEELIRIANVEAAYNIAYVLAYRGEVDRAFEWIEKSIAVNDPGRQHIAWQWQFKILHDDPRWMPLLRRMGRAPDQLAAIPFNVKLPK